MPTSKQREELIRAREELINASVHWASMKIAYSKACAARRIAKRRFHRCWKQTQVPKGIAEVEQTITFIKELR